MEKDESIYQQELIDFCEEAIKESKILCDKVLDNYKGDLIQKKFLKQISRMIDLDNQIKEKSNNLNFDDIEHCNTILDQVDILLKEKFEILDFLDTAYDK